MTEQLDINIDYVNLAIAARAEALLSGRAINFRYPHDYGQTKGSSRYLTANALNKSVLCQLIVDLARRICKHGLLMKDWDWQSYGNLIFEAKRRGLWPEIETQLILISRRPATGLLESKETAP